MILKVCFPFPEEGFQSAARGRNIQVGIHPMVNGDAISILADVAPKTEVAFHRDPAEAN
jgi:hypothetical protein